MSVFTLPAVEATYMKVIEGTIAEAAPLQSSAVLEQLKQRWIEKLHERLQARARESNAPVAASGATAPSVPLKVERSHDVVPPSDVAAPIETTTLRTLESTEDAPSSSTAVAARNDDNDGEDDDWDNAAWETVEETVKKEEPHAAALQAERTVAAVSETTQPPQPPAPAATRPSTKKRAADRPGEHGRGVLVGSQEDLYDDEDIVDEDGLSDLEDTEPDCSDLVVAQFHAVQRPHTRKAYQKGLWRIKLKHGILQIGGKEIIFNTLSGDLMF